MRVTLTLDDDVLLAALVTNELIDQLRGDHSRSASGAAASQSPGGC